MNSSFISIGHYNAKTNQLLECDQEFEPTLDGMANLALEYERATAGAGDNVDVRIVVVMENPDVGSRESKEWIVPFRSIHVRQVTD